MSYHKTMWHALNAEDTHVCLEMAAKLTAEADAEIAAKDARIKELEAEITTLALCEQDHVLLAPGRLYMFEVVSECSACQKLKEQLDA